MQFRHPSFSLMLFVMGQPEGWTFNFLSFVLGDFSSSSESKL